MITKAEPRAADHAIADVHHRVGAGPSQRILWLQRSAGNRAVARLLQRHLYDPKLVETESIMQPPVLWVKSPPTLTLMGPLDLVDMANLLSNWVANHHDSHYAPALRALRGQVLQWTRTITTEAEYFTYLKYTKARPDQLKDAYLDVAAKLAEDRTSWDLDLQALEAVIEDRVPGAAWYVQTKANLRSVFAEQDRRQARYAKLPSYERDAYEKFQRKAADWPRDARDLWRELAWLWIDSTDAGQSDKQAEETTFKELTGIYEQLLHAIDEAIQKDCKLRAPQTWDEKLRRNIYNAWGDPCTPWFSAGGHGWDELDHFQRILRIKRADEPFARTYYWVQEYLKAYRSLTDPKAAYYELVAQVIAGSIAGVGAPIGAYSNFIGEVALPFATRRIGSFLRNTVLGVHLSSIGELGGAAETGALGPKRPVPAAVGRPLPPTPAPTPDPRPPTSSVTTAPHPDPPTTAQTPATKPDPRPPTASVTTAPHPDSPTTAQTPATKAPIIGKPKWTPPAAPATKVPPPPPPPFVKASELGYRNPADDPHEVARLKQDIVHALSGIKSGTADKDLPRGWKAMYDAIKAALRQNAGAASTQVLEVLDIVWAALRNPQLYAEVIAAAWERAIAANTSIDSSLIEMAEASSGKKAVWIPRHLAQWLLDNPGAFWDLYASQPVPIVDMPLMTDSHHALTHLLQDLVVDRGLKLANKNMTGAQFRGLLAKLTQKLRPASVPDGPEVRTGGPPDLAIGDYVWQLTYDLYVQKEAHLPQPEWVGKALHTLLKIR